MPGLTAVLSMCQSRVLFWLGWPCVYRPGSPGLTDPGERMTRPTLWLLLCLAALLPLPAAARLPGPVQAVATDKVRDLA